MELQEATLEQLLDELASRHVAVLFAAISPTKADGDGLVVYEEGDRTTVLGLGVRLERYLAAMADHVDYEPQGGEGDEGDEPDEEGA